MSAFDKVIAAIDAANAEDPNRVPHEGGEIAKELLYSQRMSACLDSFEPEASEELKIAVRAQHLRRWSLARADFPEGRSGYKQWRSTLARQHASDVSELMRVSGYGDDAIERVASIVQKRKLATDPEAQCLEDVACLVFLVHEFDAFAAKHDEEKLVSIVRKTWKKMSEKAHQVALGVELPEHLAAIVGKALQP